MMYTETINKDTLYAAQATEEEKAITAEINSRKSLSLTNSNPELIDKPVSELMAKRALLQERRVDAFMRDRVAYAKGGFIEDVGFAGLDILERVAVYKFNSNVLEVRVAKANMATGNWSYDYDEAV